MYKNQFQVDNTPNYEEQNFIIFLGRGYFVFETQFYLAKADLKLPMLLSVMNSVIKHGCALLQNLIIFREYVW